MAIDNSLNIPGWYSTSNVIFEKITLEYFYL